jgi:hypothetical protein
MVDENPAKLVPVFLRHINTVGGERLATGGRM